MKPLAIDLFCGLGGWTEGLLSEGYFVVGFDNHRHVYGEHRYPAQQRSRNLREVLRVQRQGRSLVLRQQGLQSATVRKGPAMTGYADTTSQSAKACDGAK